MGGQQLYAGSILSNVFLEGQTHRFTFERPLSQFQLVNTLSPTALTNNHSFFDFINTNNSGYRFHQLTSLTSLRGDFILEQFNNGTIPGTQLLYIQESTGNFIFSPQSSGAIQLKNGVSAIPLQFFNAAGTHYAALKAGNLSSDITWTLPTTDSTGIQAVVSNGSGTLSFSSFADNLAKYIIQTADAGLPNAQVLASLSTGIVKNTTTTGVLSIATPGTDYYAPGYPTTIKDDFSFNGDPFLSTGNTSLGMTALNSLVLNNPPNTYNVALGSEALYHFTTGYQNTAVGQSSLFSLVSGNSNTSVGFYNFASLTSGNNNCSLGDECFPSLLTGDDNIGIGKYVALSLSSGNNNLIIGINSLWAATSGTSNTILGNYAAQNQTIYNDCVFIGTGSDASVNNLSNAIAIGKNSSVGTSNTCAIGAIGTAMNLIVNGAGGAGTGTINAIWNGSIINLSYGGTNANLTASNGGIVYSTASALAILPAASIAHLPLFSGASGAPSWSNTTYPNTILAGQLLYGSGLNAISGLTSAPNGVLITDSGGIPSISSTLPTSVQSNITSVGVLTGGTWNGNIISLQYGGTGANLTASNGGILYSTATTAAILSGTATARQIIMSGASTAPSWSTATYPSTTTINQILYSSSANTISGLVTANNGILITSSGGVPSISSTLPSAVQGNITTVGTISSGTWNGSVIPLQFGGTNSNLTASAGAIPYSTPSALALLAPTTANKIFMSGTGTVPAWSTATYPVTTTANQLLYSSSGNLITGLPTGNSSTLMTNGSGVPAWQSTSANFVTAIIGTANQITANSPTGTVTLSLPADVSISNTLAVGGISASYTGDFNGTVRSKRLLGNGNAPSFSVASGSGTGATASIAGSEIAGVFTLNTGTSPAGGLMVTFTLSSAMPNTNYSVIFMPATPSATITTLFNASSSQGTYIDKISTTQFSLNILSTISPSFTYKWNYIIIGAS